MFLLEPPLESLEEELSPWEILRSPHFHEQPPANAAKTKDLRNE